jgi:hypothetical protein
MGNPNGGILNVDVTLLQLGLSRCRGAAETALDAHSQEAALAALTEIVEVARTTLYEIEAYQLLNEVEVELRGLKPEK